MDMDTKQIEKCIANFYGKKYCCFADNGTTAMYLYFLATRDGRNKVLFPAITCTNPVNAALYTGLKVGFVDVDNLNYTIDFKSLDEYLSRDKDVMCVVPTHIYGHNYDREKIRFICSKYNVKCLEDSAQTYEVGNADASLVSFGHTKIFESGVGGGAILTDSFDVYQKMKALKDSITNVHCDALDADYSKKYYSIMNNEDVDISIRYHQMHLFQLTTQKYFIHNTNINKQKIYEIFKRTDEMINSRKTKAKLYLDNIDRGKVILPSKIVYEKALWRFSFVYLGNRDDLLTKVRAENIDISSWYPALNRMYETDDCCPNAEYIADHIINLWVDENHTKEMILKDVGVINSIMYSEVL